MPGKGHFKIFVYKHSVWQTSAITEPNHFDVYDLTAGCPWWDRRAWTYRRTVKVGMDAYSEPCVPSMWQERAYAYTEWAWTTPQTPCGTDVWATANGSYWNVWASDRLLEDCFETEPYHGWRLLKEDVYFP